MLSMGADDVSVLVTFLGSSGRGGQPLPGTVYEVSQVLHRGTSRELTEEKRISEKEAS